MNGLGEDESCMLCNAGLLLDVCCSFVKTRRYKSKILYSGMLNNRQTIKTCKIKLGFQTTSANETAICREEYVVETV